MTAIDELQESMHPIEESELGSENEVLNFAYAHERTAAAKAAVTAGTGRVQDSFAKVWTILRPIEREQMPNGQLWKDLIAIKNRMVFYNPAGLKPNKMKASLALMRDDHADVLKKMICQLDTDVRATA